jgi:hypothetical protein
MTQLPKSIGLFLCDQVMFERDTQKPSLIGCFTGLAVRRFPSAPKFDVFSALTDGVGRGKVDLVVTRLNTEEQIYVRSVQVQFPDPLRIIRLRFRIRDCSFPEPGWYHFALSVEGTELANCRLQINRKGSQ